MVQSLIMITQLITQTITVLSQTQIVTQFTYFHWMFTLCRLTKGDSIGVTDAD